MRTVEKVYYSSLNVEARGFRGDQGMSEALTRGIRVRVESRYVEDRSSPGGDLYFFSYEVEIANLGAVAVQLLSRRWVITDADGRREVVEGEGVVGRQPVIPPGESFTYTSFCPLPTPVGTMEGAYLLAPEGEEPFEAEIARFTLALPEAVN